jgi:AraC-like DNA-binding protein
LRFTRDWLRTWLPTPEDLAARPLHLDNGWSRALSAALATFETPSCNELPLPPGLVAEQIAVLLAMAAGTGSVGSASRHTLFDRMVQSLRDRSHESDFAPEALAREHRVSKRYVHYVFAQHGKTFGGELIDIRLQRAHRLLTDKRFADLPIGEISARCGFVEPSHFARRFRRKFGQGPAQYRKSASAVAR